jgi:SPP1 family predicted phage head-tail adaptor
MQAGKMDRRIKIERRVETQNAYGEAVITYQLLAEVWAEKKPLSGRELFTAAQFVPEGQIRYRIRFMDGVDEKCRITEGGMTYDVIHIAEIGRREGLEITAKRPS